MRIQTLRSSILFRNILLAMVFLIIFQPIQPFILNASTGGPAQPEFTKWESVTTDKMVNEFTGGFTYNLPVLEIPGPHGGGYALSLSYHSGVTPMEEASWVGYGWTLNPGAIVRNKRGFPDDWNGETVTYHNKVPKNWTVSVSPTINTELFSLDISEDKAFSVGLGFSATLRYNNYRGFGYTLGANLSAGGVASLGYSLSDGEGSWSGAINPAAILNYTGTGDKQSKEGLSKSVEMPQRSVESTINSSVVRNDIAAGIGSAATSAFMHSFSNQSRAMNFKEYQGFSLSGKISAQINPSPLPIGFQLGLSGNFTCQENVSIDTINAFGYMYSANAGTDDIMDYFVERETPYNKHDVYLGIPFSNADAFSLTGEGLTGGFRIHNKRAGHFRPNSKTSFLAIGHFGVELMAGLNLGAGPEFGAGAQTLEVTGWADKGDIPNYTFADPDGTEDEGVYLRFNNDLGGNHIFGVNDHAEQVKISDAGGSPGFQSYAAEFGSNFNLPTHANQAKRGLRSSLIAYHTNEQMVEQTSHSAIPINYLAYTKDQDALAMVNRIGPDLDPIKKGIGEFAVSDETGYLYTYGLPVFARDEKNLQYGLYKLDGLLIDSNYLAYAPNVEDSDIKLGEENDAPYASTYLLTSIKTPDYVDLTMNGPSDDDLGGWTKFKYVQVYGDPNKGDAATNWYQWRMPYNGLLYHRQEFSDSEDDLGSMTSGKKEIYCLDEIETKTHIAKFITSLRDDGIEAEPNHQTAASSSAAMGSKKLFKLNRIELRTKDGNPGTLIRTVHFEYDYSLMPNIPNLDKPEPKRKIIILSG